jgi:hypothetical protein
MSIAPKVIENEDDPGKPRIGRKAKAAGSTKGKAGLAK